MDFDQFKEAVDTCAAARALDSATMWNAVASCQPELHGTIAAQVKWHDDRSTYTGVYAQVRTCTLCNSVVLSSLLVCTRDLHLTMSWNDFMAQFA
jgi:hypothetical protein